jgi:hypothetical protein
MFWAGRSESGFTMAQGGNVAIMLDGAVLLLISLMSIS